MYKWKKIKPELRPSSSRSFLYIVNRGLTLYFTDLQVQLLDWFQENQSIDEFFYQKEGDFYYLKDFNEDYAICIKLFKDGSIREDYTTSMEHSSLESFLEFQKEMNE